MSSVDCGEPRTPPPHQTKYFAPLLLSFCTCQVACVPEFCFALLFCSVLIYLIFWCVCVSVFSTLCGLVSAESSAAAPNSALTMAAHSMSNWHFYFLRPDLNAAFCFQRMVFFFLFRVLLPSPARSFLCVFFTHLADLSSSASSAVPAPPAAKQSISRFVNTLLSRYLFFSCLGFCFSLTFYFVQPF